MLQHNVSEQLESDSVCKHDSSLWGRECNFVLVGNGEQTNGNCGRFRGFYGCSRDDLHDRVGIDDYADLDTKRQGMGFFKVVRFNCGKPSCPVCYETWAKSEAHLAEARLRAAALRYGKLEHIVCSVPPILYGLSMSELRSRAVKALLKRGVAGGFLIFHGFRYDRIRHWYWSVHFHVVGFILGGYPCRSCQKQYCSGCASFEGRNLRESGNDGFVFKVLGERKTVFGTLWYQLNHATIDVSRKRFHAATWFGVCSYRKLKMTVEKKKDLCPLCQHELHRHKYFGSHPIVTDPKSDGYRGSFVAQIYEDGRRVWVDLEESDGG